MLKPHIWNDSSTRPKGPVCLGLRARKQNFISCYNEQTYLDSLLQGSHTSHTMTKHRPQIMTRRPKPHLCTQRKPITPASRRAIRYPSSSPSAKSNITKGPKTAIQVGDYAPGIQTLQAEVGGCGVLLPSHVLAYPFILQRLGPPIVLLIGEEGVAEAYQPCIS